MPELPEVETIKRVIEPQIKGRVILQGTAVHPQVIAHPEAETFCDTLRGQRVQGADRKGKFLLINLDSGDQLVVHLRMTGSLYVAPPDFPLEKHTHVIFKLENGQELRFVDMRRFGRIWLIRQGEADTFSGVMKLGPEPFDADFNGAYLQKTLANKKRAIKDCLLDQHIVTGIGNIYSDEILFATKIHPQRSASSLSAEEYQTLAEWIPQVLLRAIEQNHISPEEYLQERGMGYRSTPFFKVYGKKGQPCPVCGESLCRVTVAGRSSTYCPGCQK